MQTLLLPGGGGLLTAGGNSVKLWDLVGGGRLMHSFSHHQKLITAMTLDGAGTRLLTGGLDGLVKVYELGTFAVAHSMRYDAPVLSLGVSPDNTRLVVGCTDASLVVKTRPVKVADVVSESKSARVLRGGSYRYFLRGQATVAAADDIRVETGRKQRLRPYDAALRAFDYRGALDAALVTRDPVVVASMLEELVARRGLRTAVAGRDEAGAEPLLSFLVKHVADPRYASLLLDVSDGAWGVCARVWRVVWRVCVR
jgi:U3 small nucleolar RNA-associated protein 15